MSKEMQDNDYVLVLWSERWVLKAAILLLLGIFLPFYNPESFKIAWFWNQFEIDTSEQLAVLTIRTILVFVPLILYRFLSARVMAISILGYVIFMCVFLGMQTLNSSEIWRFLRIYNKSTLFEGGLVVVLSIISIGVGNRLMLARPNHKFPRLMMRIASIILFTTFIVVISLTIIRFYMNFRGWERTLLPLSYFFLFLVMALAAFISSYRKQPSSLILTLVYILIAYSVILKLYVELTTTSDSYPLMDIKFALVIFASAVLLSSSLYSSLLLFSTANSTKPPTPTK